MKSTPQGVNSGPGDRGACVTWKQELKISQSSKKKTNVKHKDTSRDTWNNINCNSTNITGVPEREGNEKTIENIFDKIMTEKFPNLGKETESKPKKQREPQTGGT